MIKRTNNVANKRCNEKKKKKKRRSVCFLFFFFSFFFFFFFSFACSFVWFQLLIIFNNFSIYNISDFFNAIFFFKAFFLINSSKWIDHPILSSFPTVCRDVNKYFNAGNVVEGIQTHTLTHCHAHSHTHTHTHTHLYIKRLYQYLYHFSAPKFYIYIYMYIVFWRKVYRLNSWYKNKLSAHDNFFLIMGSKHGNTDRKNEGNVTGIGLFVEKYTSFVHILNQPLNFYNSLSSIIMTNVLNM